LLPERLKNILRGSRAGERTAQNGHTSFAVPRSVTRFQSNYDAFRSRQSRGLEQFFGHIRDQVGLTILDLGGATQQNVSFITNLGHKLYSEDFLSILKDSFSEEDGSDQSNAGRIDYFLRQSLDYEEGQFDGVLVWDVLEYMSPALLSATVERLHHIARPGSYLLAFFHSEVKPDAVPCYSFRIEDFNVLQVAEGGAHRPAQLFNNRSLEKLFQRFESVKFFLTREHLREVIVKR